MARVKHVESDIIKSAEDKRLYRGLELTNGMKILLISDKVTDKSSAAMDVHIGHMSDPSSLPGLAHFCEHMLFLGTEKYPSENEYSKFLSEHGGGSNAFTSSEHTNFFFDVGPEHLQSALDRFAQFFHAPLFTESATEREVNAVNSENDKNLQNDGWRIHQLEKSTCDPNHDFAKFGTGNKETLLTGPREQGIDTRAELLKFHNKYYSSNIMSFSVLGRESLDELQEMVLPLFDDVENKYVLVPKWENHPVGPEQVKYMAEIVPVKDIRSLSVTWPTPDLHPYYKSAPGHYLGHLIGHEGKGSLLSELKSKGWVNTLCGGEKAGANGFGFFIVNVDLTEEGIEHVHDIISMIFQCIRMLREARPHKWLFDEIRDLSAMSFRFKDKEKPRSYTCGIAGLLRDYPLRECLSGGYIADEYNPELIEMVLSKLTPDQVRVAVVGKKFEGQTDKTEKWYGTNYKLTRIPEATIEAWRNVPLNPNLHLPAKNEFIPTNFELVDREEDASELPQIIYTSDFTRLWFKQDDKFLLPKACVGVDLTSPYAYMDPLSACLTHMFVRLFQDALTEYTYDADLAGLHYSLHNNMFGLSLNLSGYNDKMHILLERIVERMTTLKIDRQRFDILKENYIRGLKNFKAEQPHQHAIYYTSVILTEHCWTKTELLEATDEMTCEILEQFVPRLLSKLFLEIFIYGNVTKKHAREMVDTVESTLKKHANTKTLPDSQRRRFREVQLPDNSCYLYKRVNDVHKGSGIEVYYQCSIQDTASNMVLELFTQIIKEPFFDILRTQEQLGYLVFSGLRRSNGVQGLRVLVQSDKNPQYVEARIEAFLNKMQAHIEEMDEATFNKHVEALATKRLEAPKKLTSQNNKYWGEIESMQYNFDRDTIEVAHLRTLTKDDVLQFYKELIAHNAPKRHKLTVHITSGVESEEAMEQSDPAAQIDGLNDVPPVKEAVAVSDINSFKRGIGLFPLPKPFKPIAAQKSKL